MSASPLSAPFGAVVNVFYFTADLNAAVVWYSARLGGPPALEAAALASFDLGAARLTLHRIDGFNQTGPAGAVAYWDVRDIDAVAAEWIRHGAAAHRGPRTIMTGERLCQLRDPFGNLVGLRQAPAA